MSLPQFDVQGSLFESLGSIAPRLFGDQDKYQLFARERLAGVGPMPRTIGRRLHQRQRTTGDRTGGVVGRPHLSVLGTGARPPSRRDGQIPLGLETRLESE